MRNTTLGILIFCFISTFSLVDSLSAQGLLKGKIVDASSREPLETATIQIQNTYLGTISNSSGEFELQIPEFPATILIRFIGYNSQAILIESISDPIFVELQPVPQTLREVVVTGEDPAIGIMREVIRRKIIWRDLLETFEAEAYSRQRLENDSGIVTLTESLSKVYWDKSRGIREVIKSRSQTSNIDATENFASATNLPNFYDDDINISGFNLVGVTHPNALSFYHFKLEGFRQIDDQTVFDISVRPKRRLQPTFEGHIAILDEDYAMIEADLRPGESVMFPPPIQEFGLWYKQQFSNFGGEFWFPVDVIIEGTIKFGFPGLQFPAIKFAQLSRLTNYLVNQPTPDSLFAIERRILVDSVSVNYAGSESRINTMRVPLNGNESKAYETLDSTQTLEKAFRPTGALSRFIEMDDDEEDRPAGPIARILGKAFNGVSPVLGYNRVDEARLGLNYRIPIKGNFRPSVGFSYLTGTKDLDYSAGISYRIRKKYNFDMGFKYQYVTSHLFDKSMYDPYFVASSMLLASPDYFNYFKQESFSTDVNWSKRNSEISWKVGLGNSRVQNMDKVTNYSFPGGFIQRENPIIDEGTDRFVEFAVMYGEDDVPFSMISINYIELGLRQGLTSVNGDFDYTRLYARADWQFDTFYKRRFLANSLNIRLIAGTSLGDLPYHQWHGLDSKLGYFGPFGTIKTFSKMPFEAESVVAFFWEHNFRTIPFEALGLMSIARKGISFLIHGSHGYTHSDFSRHQNRVFSSYQSENEVHELGASINGIFSLIRLDAAKRVNGPGYFLGFSVARVF